ncbi:MAG: DUF2007 domain-containing protein [bacterium]
MSLSTAYRAPDELMANAIKDLLEQNGVPAVIRSFQIPAYDGIAQVMRPSWGDVLVEESNLERARELIDGFLDSDGAPGEPPETD